MSFVNKVVIITGAGSGIGEATAVNFAKLSANLTLIDINPDYLNKVAEKCNMYNAKVLKAVADVSKTEEIKQAVDNTVKEYGRIDVVVNNAGIYNSAGILDADALNAFDSMIGVNLKSMVALTHYAAAALIESKGCVINISSAMGEIVSKDGIFYNISKAGVYHFTKTVALELADKGVRVNSISPGPVKTNIFLHSGNTGELKDKYLDALFKGLPLQNRTQPEEIADMIEYLASDKARSITGAVVNIDCAFRLSGLQRLLID